MSSSGEEDDRQSAASQEWDEWEEDEEEQQAQSLFSDALLPTPEAALEHDATHHGFDLREYRQQVREMACCAATHKNVCVCRATSSSVILQHTQTTKKHSSPSTSTTSSA